MTDSLTITDNHSRFLLQCRGLIHPTTEAVKPWFEWVFREYGLPQVMRSDNGAPFASRAVGGLSALSAWWIRLGIRPERARPGKPCDNGRHERMHRSLKAAVITPPARTFAEQQQRFDDFVEEFNWERSHESLQRKTPGCVHQPSPRPFPTKLHDIEYDESFTVRRVRCNGEFKWCGQRIYLSQVLAKEPIGLKPLDEDRWEIRYSFHRLATFDARTQTILTDKHWHQNK